MPYTHSSIIFQYRVWYFWHIFQTYSCLCYEQPTVVGSYNTVELKCHILFFYENFNVKKNVWAFSVYRKKHLWFIYVLISIVSYTNFSLFLNSFWWFVFIYYVYYIIGISLICLENLHSLFIWFLFERKLFSFYSCVWMSFLLMIMCDRMKVEMAPLG